MSGSLNPEMGVSFSFSSLHIIALMKRDRNIVSAVLEEITSVSKSSVCKKRFVTCVTNSAYN